MKYRAIGIALALSSCNQAATKTAEATSSPSASNSPTKDGVDSASVGTVAITTDALSSLNLSQSLSPTLPAGVTATGDGAVTGTAGTVNVAALTGAQKSVEACFVRQHIKEAKGQLETIAMQLCQIQAQKNMKAGGKYKMTVPSPGGGGGGAMPTPSGSPDIGGGGAMPTPSGSPGPGGGGFTPPMMLTGSSDQTMSIFLDNNVKGQFTVYTCMNDKLTQKISLAGATAAGSKGTYKVSLDMSGMGTVQMQGTFDNGVDVADRQRVTSQAVFQMTMGTSTMYMRNNMLLDLSKDKISVIRVANESSGSMGDFSMSQREIGAALIGPNLGMALFQHTFDGDHPSVFAAPTLALADGKKGANLLDQQVETARGFFNNKGEILSQDIAPAFAKGGHLYVDETMLPKLPPDDFKVTFDSTDWDCSGTEDFTMDTTSAAFTACTDSFASEFSSVPETCTDTTTFAPGAKADDVTTSVVDQRSTDQVPPIGDTPPPDPTAP